MSGTTTNGRSTENVPDASVYKWRAATVEMNGDPHWHAADDWFWEGNVQQRVADFLKQEGWSIVSVADTAKREPGIEIQAERMIDGLDGKLLVEVKGFPPDRYVRGPTQGMLKRTKPALQAKKWYADVLLKAIVRQSQYPNASVAIALPDKRTYRNLIRTTERALTKLELQVFVVAATGEVRQKLPTVVNGLGIVKTPRPTTGDIDALVAFLPRLYAPGFEPIVRWGGGEKTVHGTTTMLWPEYNVTVHEFTELAARDCWADLDYVPEKASSMIADGRAIRNASMNQIKTMLTFCVRGERFSDGHWGTMIEEGVVRALLERLLELRAGIQGNS